MAITTGLVSATTTPMLLRLVGQGRLAPEALPLLKQTIREYVTGGRRLTARNTVQTNDLGEFRLYGLPSVRHRSRGPVTSTSKPIATPSTS